MSRTWQYEPAFEKLNDLPAILERVHAVDAIVQTADDPVGWRGDSLRAGGGALLNGAYEQVDMLTALLGLPEEVYAQTTSAVASTAPRNYDTEDAASLVLGFSGERIGSVSVCRGARQGVWQITFHGRTGCLKVEASKLTVTRRGRSPVVRRVRSKNPIAPMIAAFGSALLNGNERLASSARDHLEPLAVIEAAYLSAKTGTPESPLKFL